MAKRYRRIGVVIEAEQFLASANPATWPDRVQVNESSPTGYSWGTLEPVENPDGSMGRDGFEISDTNWIIYKANNQLPTVMFNEQFFSIYEEE